LREIAGDNDQLHSQRIGPMSKMIALSSLLLSVAAIGCASSPSDSDSATADTKKGSSGGSIAGDYTVTNTQACGGTFNFNNDPTTIVADSSTVSISQYIDDVTGDSVFFTGPVGDVITRPTQDLIDAGYTTVERTIGTYSADNSVFTYTEYLYDMSLTDAEGLATGLFETLVLTADKGNVTYRLTYSDGEHYTCDFVAAK
jgi:hypothetical protein